MAESRPTLPRWTEVVDSVQETLTHAESEVARLEAAAEQLGLPGPDALPRWQEVPVEQATTPLDGSLARASQVAAGASAALQQAEENLRQWLAQVEAQRAGLVKEGPHSIR